MVTYIFHREQDAERFHSLCSGVLDYSPVEGKVYVEVASERDKLAKNCRGEQLSKFLSDREFIRKEKRLRQSLFTRKTR